MLSDLENLVNKISEKTMIIIDGYHAFCSREIDLRKIKNRIFYLGGGYKYAQSGEGICFMHVPEWSDEFVYPENTGWFAEFSQLQQKPNGNVGFAIGGDRFWGATFEVSGLYRFCAVQNWMRQLKITPESTHVHAIKLQSVFLNLLQSHKLNLGELLNANLQMRGNFLCFKNKNAEEICNNLLKENVIVDSRGDCLRFGFGIYHEESDVNQLIHKISTCI